MHKSLLISTITVSTLLLSGCGMQHPADTILYSNSHEVMSLTGDTSHSENHAMMGTIDSEQSFIVQMIPHHQEAVDSASIVLANSSNMEMRNLAQAIIDAQTKEIGMMQQWLNSWYPDSQLVSSYQPMMPNLETLSGSDLDRAFLEGMIGHHEGAIQMAQDVLNVEHRSEIMQLANNIISSQNNEITLMKQMLENMQ